MLQQHRISSFCGRLSKTPTLPAAVCFLLTGESAQHPASSPSLTWLCDETEQEAQHGDLRADQVAKSDQAEQRQKERKAKEAATKLQELGAIVYPPGDKQAVEWGILAGLYLLDNVAICVVNAPMFKQCWRMTK